MSALALDERTLLADGAARAAAGVDAWRTLGRLGALSLTLPEADGGAGAGLLDAFAVAEAVGAAGAVPFAELAVLPGALIARLADAGLRARLGAMLAGGEQAVAVVAPGAACADPGVPVGAVLFWNGTAALADSPSFAPVAGFAGPRLAVHASSSTPTALLPGPDPLEHAIVAAAGETAGALAALVEHTRQYLLTRRQFGRKLADFQVLAHRLADMWVAAEEARALALMAAHEADRAPETLQRLAAATKVKMAGSARLVAQSAIHLHGAIGTAAEAPIAPFLRRAEAFVLRFGTPAQHLERFAAP